MKINVLDARLAGYAYLLKKFEIVGLPHFRSSSVSDVTRKFSTVKNGIVYEVFTLRYWPGDTVCDHLVFALKYDGVNLGLLSQIFQNISQDELVGYIKSTPTGKYARRVWFFYEFLMDRKLPIENISSGNYIDALDDKNYFTVKNGAKSSRHRVVNNLLGPRTFCPVVRKSKTLSEMDLSLLRRGCENLIDEYPPQLFRRALSFFYNKETKSSFSIENITPTASRVEKFIASLKLAEKEDFCEKEMLVELQNRIVDSRFKESSYRSQQNYVGESIAYQKEIIHYIAPKPDDLQELMDGFIESHRLMMHGDVSSLVHASVVSYGFVFLHPFEDGNGRIHRFLIHNILSLRKLVPFGLMFPVSAVMLKNPADYDASLEAFSRPLLGLIDYSLDEVGKMSVENETAYFYRYMDMTSQAEALYDFVSQTVERELENELIFLLNHDKVKRLIQDIIDMPNRLIDLFIQFCLQNNGKISERKRSSYFDFLTDEEVFKMEKAVIDVYGNL